jgi:putative ABC transport system substrate-binding protein
MLAFVLLVSGCGAKKPKVYRVGILSGIDFLLDCADGFKAGMEELGYVEGENITYDLQKASVDLAEYRSVLQQFVADEVDLILTFPSEASIEAKAATQGTDIPVVFTYAFIEGMGLVDSVREPGGNVTGVRYPGPDVALKRLEVMHELMPQATHILVPYIKDYPITEPQLEALRPAASAAGVTLVEAPVADAAELETALQAYVEPDGVSVDAIVFVAGPLGVSPDTAAVIGKFAYDHKLPMGGAVIAVEGREGVFDVGVDAADSGKLAAPIADKILKGTPAGEVPVVSAEMYLLINYKAAQELGITVPEALLAQATQVIR